MELYLYTIVLTLVFYYLISIFLGKLVSPSRRSGINTYKRRESILLSSGAIVLLLFVISPLLLSAGNKVLDYHYLIISSIIAIPTAWLGIQISHNKPTYGFYIFEAVLVAAGLIVKLLKL